MAHQLRCLSHYLPNPYLRLAIGMKHINPSIKSRLEKDKTGVKSLSYYVDGIKDKQDHYVLSECITLLESDQEIHKDISLQTLMACYGSRTSSFRFGITGSPGVGKSTFIDSIAAHFSNKDHQVGILTVDPSSTDGKGSILGDKTRMEELVKDKDVFIRPSPSNRHLGGLNQYTYEAIILCEAAGIDRLLIETVGVGQSEVDVSHHVDATILLVLPGGGDSLQGIKKGVLEKADLIIIHKSDGDAKRLAIDSAKEYKEAIHLRRKGGEIPVLNYSSITGEGRQAVTDALDQLIDSKKEELVTIRKKQEERWLQSRMKEHISEVVMNRLKEEEMNQMTELPTTSPFDRLSFLKDNVDISINIKS